ncbi:MAG: YcaO-like family protein [Beijerinckiaceae bacterium]
MLAIDDLPLSAFPVRTALEEIRSDGGSLLAAMALRLDRLFRIVHPFAPGLVFVGAQAHSPVLGGPAQAFSLAGTGLDLKGALTSCLGEAAERLSQCERQGDCATLPLAAAMPMIDPAGLPLLVDGATASTAIDCVSGTDFATGAPRLLPADWALRRSKAGPFRLAGTALSSGAAAGPSLELAQARAVLELVERDAAALWWTGGRRGLALPLESPALMAGMELLELLRAGPQPRRSWLLDLTTDLAIPVIAALSCDEEGRGLACGLAARFSASDAARSAVFELMQMELALILATIKRDELSPESLTVTERQHLARATLAVAHCALLHPVGVGDVSRDYPAAGKLPDLAAALRTAGISATLVDLTREDYGIPVGFAFAPALQRLPGDGITERLSAAMKAHGGGCAMTGGVALL